MKRKFKTSPLPFQGQKRRFVSQLNTVLDNYPSQSVYVDLFGGSGLLAHTVKTKHPNAKVIWNDFDNFKQRLDSITQTNILLEKMRLEMFKHERKTRLSDTVKQRIIAIIKQHEATFGYVDYITISSSLLFSGKFVQDLKGLIKETFYNKVRINNYDSKGYLEGVERVSKHYKEVFNHYKTDSTVFLVDPPYLSTDTATYSKENYWRLRDYLDVLNVLEEHRYLYFTSNKSQIIELCDWIETRTFKGNPFKGATISTTSNNINFHSSYTDIMLYK